MPCALLQEGRLGKFLTGDRVTHGDLALFCHLSFLTCGWGDAMAGGARQAAASSARLLLLLRQVYLRLAFGGGQHSDTALMWVAPSCRERVQPAAGAQAVPSYSVSIACLVCFPAGFPADLLDSYPVLKEYRNSVAALPEIAAFYR